MAFARLIRLSIQIVRFIAIALLGMAISGCAILAEPEQTLTPTPNPTLLAISRMLTQTRAAPTSTRTVTPAPTRAVTPSLTIEIPVTGDRKLPAQAGVRFTAKNGAVVTILSQQRITTLSRLKALEGNAFLDLEVLLENESGQALSYNPLDFRLTAAEDTLLQPTVDALSPALLSGDLQPCEWVRGHLAFSITENEITGLVRYRPVLGVTRQNEETWFDLSPLADQPASSTPELAGKQEWPGSDLPQAGGRQVENGIALTIEQVEVSSRLPIRKAEKGKRFVILAVKIENIEHTRAPYNPLYFRVKNADGYEFLPVVGSPETSLQPGSLGRGQMARNIVIFEVPETDSELVVTYLPTVLAEEYAPIRSVLLLSK